MAESGSGLTRRDHTDNEGSNPPSAILRKGGERNDKAKGDFDNIISPDLHGIVVLDEALNRHYLSGNGSSSNYPLANAVAMDDNAAGDDING